MTATWELVIWVAVNILGAFIFAWLSVISWERRIAVLVDKVMIEKKYHLRAATKQLRNRVLGFIAHNVAILIGIVPMLGLQIPYHGAAWIGICIVTVIIIAAATDLYGEFRST